MKVNCPKCKKEVFWEENPNKPFCSERCRLIDLGDWASEKFKVPSDHDSSEDFQKAQGITKGSKLIRAHQDVGAPENRSQDPDSDDENNT